MINRFLWEDLAQDDTDDNQAEFEVNLQASKPSFEITDFQYLDYWKSLKTLLGDTQNDWASKRIIDRQERLEELQFAYDKDNLPAIFISEIGSFTPRVNAPDSWEGEVCLSIHCPENSNNLLSFKIYQRIRHLWFPIQPNFNYKRPFEKCLASNPNLGIVNCHIRLLRLEEIYDRSRKMILQIRYDEF